MGRDITNETFAIFFNKLDYVAIKKKYQLEIQNYLWITKGCDKYLIFITNFIFYKYLYKYANGKIVYTKIADIQ